MWKQLRPLKLRKKLKLHLKWSQTLQIATVMGLAACSTSMPNHSYIPTCLVDAKNERAYCYDNETQASMRTMKNMDRYVCTPPDGWKIQEDYIGDLQDAVRSCMK